MRLRPRARCACMRARWPAAREQTMHACACRRALTLCRMQRDDCAQLLALKQGVLPRLAERRVQQQCEGEGRRGEDPQQQVEQRRKKGADRDRVPVVGWCGGSKGVMDAGPRCSVCALCVDRRPHAGACAVKVLGMWPCSDGKSARAQAACKSARPHAARQVNVHMRAHLLKIAWGRISLKTTTAVELMRIAASGDSRRSRHSGSAALSAALQSTSDTSTWRIPYVRVKGDDYHCICMCRSLTRCCC